MSLAARVEDEEFQSRLKHDLVEFHLASGHRDAALTLADTIPDYRRGMALAKVAAEFARQAEHDRVAPLLDKALAQTSFPHEWQREAIRAEVAIAWVAAGSEPAAREIAAKLTEDSAKLRARAGMEVERIRLGLPVDLAAFETVEKSDKLAPEMLALARGVLEIAELQMAAGKSDREAIAPLCEKAEAIIRACRVTAGEELLDTGILWRRRGDGKKSAEILALAIRHLPPGVEMQGWRPGYFAKMVGLYAEAGEKERVATLLELGRKGVEPMHAFHQPPALCQLAEAELVAGFPERAEATWTRAVEIALANPNHSSRFVGATQVSFSIARAGRALPEKIVQQIATLTPAEVSLPEKTEK